MWLYLVRNDGLSGGGVVYTSSPVPRHTTNNTSGDSRIAAARTRIHLSDLNMFSPKTTMPQ
ncbi:hypothetical protein B0H10DRAFT_764063 [Mycena sp. CBHHK59/15]|nr:hypothetical protein B0H10DRAFT_764063 [Mycena sp. CBHHK59/15]